MQTFGDNSKTFNRGPIQDLKGHESLSDYQKRKTKETTKKRDERQVMNEINKMFL